MEGGIRSRLFYLVVFLFLVFSLVDGFSNLRQDMVYASHGMYPKAVVFFSIYVFGVVTVALLLLCSRLTRVIAVSVIFLTVFTELLFRHISGLGFGYSDALLVLQELGSPLVGESFRVYFPLVLYSVLESVGLVGLLCLFLFFVGRMKASPKKCLVFSGLLLLVTSVSAYGVLKYTNGLRIEYPVFFKEPLLVAYAYNNSLYVGGRRDVELRITHRPLAKHIVFVVDESIRGDMLSLNGFGKATTPYLLSQDSRVLNYGVASSGSVCSSYSHSILLTGVQLSQLPDVEQVSRKIPTLFHYARKAGFLVEFLDAQNRREAPDDFLMKSDFDVVDDSYFIKDDFEGELKPYEKDLLLIKKLKEFIGGHRKSLTFSFIVKQGCHFSYTDKYPRNEIHFRPVLKGSGWGKWSLEVRPRLLNTYFNCIRWEVDHFFKVLSDNLGGEDVLVVYTSDHGQNLIDDLKLKRTHCAKGPAPRVMAEVPLFLFPLSEEVLDRLRLLYKAGNVNHSSHFNVFSTILYLMGYDRNELENTYGPSLFSDLHRQRRKFLSGDMFGRSRVYKNDFD